MRIKTDYYYGKKMEALQYATLLWYTLSERQQTSVYDLLGWND